MLFFGRSRSTEPPRTGARWMARLVGAGLGVMVLLPVGAWAASPDVAGPTVAATAVTAGGSGGAALTLVGASALSDQILANEMAKGLEKPRSSAGQSLQGPQVMLWDDIERPGSMISSGSVDAATTVFTSSVWH